MDGVDSTLFAHQTHPSGWRLQHVAAAITYGAVFTLAVLNPLLCLLHCTYAQRYATLSSEQHILCELRYRSPALISAPLTAVWGSPQAVYQALLLSVPALLVVIVMVARLASPAARVRAHIPLPEFPPPKR